MTTAGAMPGVPAPAPPTWSPRLCLAYWLCARAALFAALVLAWREPAAITGSQLHPTTLACAHLTALGFVTTSILGAFQVVGPLALRLPLRADWRDWALLGALPLATSGVVSHLLLGSYSGIAWSGGLLLVALLLRLPGWLAILWRSNLTLPVRSGVALAWLALPATAVLGILISMHYQWAFLPAARWEALVGHAHLGACGFATLMLASLGQRLLPMFLPAAVPGRALSWAAVLGIGLGAFGLGVTMPFFPGLGPVFAFVLAAGVLAFLASIVAMLAHGRPAPRDLPRPDPTRPLVLFGLAALSAAVVVGILLVTGVAFRAGPHLVYGVLGLLGGLGSFVLGLGTRLLPLAGWHAAWHDRQPAAMPAPPRRVGSVTLAWTTAVGWISGVATLVFAVATESPAAARAGVALLATAILADSANVVHGWRRRHGGPAADL